MGENNPELDSSVGASDRVNHGPPWLETLVQVACSGYIQPALIILSLSWTTLRLGAWRASSVSPRSHKPRTITTYESLGQALRGAASASSILASRLSYDQWPNAIALGYVFTLGLLRLFGSDRTRRLLLHQINAFTVGTLTVMAAADVLPLLVIGSIYRPKATPLTGTILLSVTLFVAAMTPREWVPPADSALPKGIEVKATREETCSWLDYYCTFGRTNDLIRKGWENSISMSELEDLPWDYAPELLRSNVAALRQRHKTTAKTLFMLLWPDLSYTMVFAGMFFVGELAAPFGLYHLLEYLRRPEEAVFYPYVWLFIMFGGRVVGSIMQQQFSFTGNRATIKLKIALTAELYQRAMASKELDDGILSASTEESSKSQKTSSTGQLTNLISTDIKTIMEARIMLMIIPGIPTGILMALVGLYSVVDWPCFVGLAIMLLSSPLSAWIVARVGDQQEELKDAQDSRISIASEYLRSVKIVKYFGWEDTVVHLLTQARAREQQHLWMVDLLSIAINLTAYCVPTISLMAIFGLYVGVGKQPLTASVAYTTISLLGLIQDNFAAMASTGMLVPKMFVSFGRLDRLFAATSPPDVYHDGPLRIKGATFRCNKTAEFLLEDLSIDFVQGGLNVITGQSGSGKTTLLLAILGETIQESGHVTRPRDVAYASQSPWLQAQSIRDNILFSTLYDADRYRAVVTACCLQPDLDELSEGDKTDVGENGSALSGGQRARVSLARALYSNSPLLLLDDIFWAIDTKTAFSLWNRVFCTDLLRDRTVVLVTQQTWLPAEADLSITLDNGRVKSTEQTIGHVRRPRTVRWEEDDVGIHHDISNSSITHGAKDDLVEENFDEDHIEESEDVDEEVALTSISSRLSFFKYMLYFGSPIEILLTASTLVLYNGTELATNLWMSRWVDTADQGSINETPFYLGIYIALSLAGTFSEGIVLLSFMRGTWVAAKRLHAELVSAVMNVSLSWFKDNPAGRVINRLSGDMDSLDQNIAEPLTEFLDQIIKNVLLLGAVTSILPAFVVPATVLSALGAVLGEVYSRSTVFIKRLVASSHSPVVSHISESLDGMAVIRANSDMLGVFNAKLNRSLYASAQATAAKNECDQWLKFRINALAALIIVPAGLLALSQQGIISAGLVGFSVSRASEMSSSILRLVFEMNELNVEMQAFHRVLEYCKLTPEEPIGEKTQSQIATHSNDAEHSVPLDWPRTGRVEFRNATIRYSSDGQDILKDTNLTFNAGERVAIVGRTGSGKSTLVLSLLRFTHIVSGKVLYDGVDITAIPRRRLRQAVATIPQEALLLQGTISSNLDPTGTVPEPQLQKALDMCASIAAMQADERPASRAFDPETEMATAQDGTSETQEHRRLTLSTPVSTGGSNFSHGQRQVLALCRILVRRSKLMLLDEATSSMDSETDAGIQDVLRGELECIENQGHCLITIAHRLRTIADYDKVVVMGAGRVLEVGSPSVLWERKGAFHDMVMHGGEQSTFEAIGA